MTLHLLGFPHRDLVREYETDAYVARTRVLGSMLARYGRVILYGGEENESRVTEHVPIVDRAWQRRHFPGQTPSDVFSDYDANRPHWLEFNVRAADAIRKRAHPGDILGITMGTSQQLVATLLADLELVPVEVGVGYKGVWANFRVYESWAWRMFHAGLAEGRTGQETASDVRNFDEVIPRAYEVADFPAGAGDGGYFLFLGRVVSRKGPHIAAEVCRRIGAKLVVAGQGVSKVESGKIIGADGTVLEGDVEFAGVVGPEERARLLGGATALLSPTLYLGPFEGTHAEALLTGTPVLATDHGVFTETIADGINGYRCPTLADFIRGARDVRSLSRATIRRNAVARYGTAAVGPVFDAYLNRIATLRAEGWYAQPLERRAA